MLAPVARTGHIEGILRYVAENMDNLVRTLVDGLGYYNWVPPPTVGSHALETFCDIPIIKGVCKAIFEAMIDETVMNVDRFPAAFSWVPSG